MNKNPVVAVVAVLLLIVGLSGCIDSDNENNSSHPEKFVGTWVYKEIPSIQFTLFEDGECSYIAQAGTWEVKEGKLIIDRAQNRLVFSYTFSNNNQTLILTGGGQTETYIKQ